MENLDNKEALAESKVLILYILNQIENGILEDSLYKIISSVNNMNYFYYKEVLIDLITSNLVGLYAIEDEEDSVLKITNDGKESLSLNIDVLPGIVKLKADSVFKEEITAINNESSVVSEFFPKGENDYIVRCKIVDNNETVFEVKTFAGSEERAKKIVDNWNNNPDKIYPKILDLLLDVDM